MTRTSEALEPIISLVLTRNRVSFQRVQKDNPEPQPRPRRRPNRLLSQRLFKSRHAEAQTGQK